MTWLEFSGQDAREYLHRLSTVDARRLQPGQGAPGFFLNAQGRIQAVFRLWCLADTRFAFELEAGPDGKLKQALLDWIEQYHFGEKFDVQENPQGLSSLWILELNEQEPWTSKEAGGVRICSAGADDYGRALFTLWASEEKLEEFLSVHAPDASELSLEGLERLRIERLSPRPGYELTQESNPLEAGATSGLSMNKGCYPGQEVIEKTLSLGQPAQRLCRFEGTGPPPARGASVWNQSEPPASLGKITSAVAASDGKFLALGFVRKIHAKEGLESKIDGVEGLARIAAVSTAR